jgi:nucleotide-binding universal stress UspA family protein
MSIRTILVPLSGGAATEGTIETACRLAQRFGAHLEVFHVRADPHDSLPLVAQDISAAVAAELIAIATRESEERAFKAKAAFDAAVLCHALPLRSKPLGMGQPAAGSPSVQWHEEIGDAASIIPRRARLNDLVVLGQSGRVVDKPSTDTPEETIVRGGRPVLLAPVRPAMPVGEVIAIAWNASAEAARAVAASLPFLYQAREIHILTASGGDEHAPDTELANYLAWHGIVGTAHGVRSLEGVGTGELLLAAARDYGADLLVMGGYGHAPWREMIFGGATRQIIGTSRLPILLAH